MELHKYKIFEYFYFVLQVPLPLGRQTKSKQRYTQIRKLRPGINENTHWLNSKEF